MSKSIQEYLPDFVEYCEVEKGLSATTGKNYARFLQQFFRWLKNNKLEKIRPKELTEYHILKYHTWLSHLPNKTKKTSAGLHMSTQTRYLIALRALLDYFYEKDISCVSSKKIKLPKVKGNREIKFLNIEQVRALLTAPDTKTIAGLRDRAILETLFSTGLRVAELSALERKHLVGSEDKTDFEVSIIARNKHPRTLYFSTRTLYYIHEYLSLRDDHDQALFVRFKGPTNNSLRLGVRGIEAIVSRYTKLSGIPILATPNTLRHSFATDLLNNNVVYAGMTQKFLKHQNIGTTQVYTHVTSKQLRDIHKKFQAGNKL